jgi:hypothetical protein
MPQEDHGTCTLNPPEEILWVVFPANGDTTTIMKPSKQTLDLPATAVAAQGATVLCTGLLRFQRCGAINSTPSCSLDPLIQGIVVVAFIASQSLWCFAEESPLERGYDERGSIWRNADHLHGERKTMAGCDYHDSAAFASFCRANTRAPYFAELKLGSKKASLRSSFPRSRRSSASVCSRRSNSPESYHCWKRR